MFRFMLYHCTSIFYYSGSWGFFDLGMDLKYCTIVFNMDSSKGGKYNLVMCKPDGKKNFTEEGGKQSY